MKRVHPTLKSRTRVKLCALGAVACALLTLMSLGNEAPRAAGNEAPPAAAQATPCPVTPPVTLSSTPPTDVCIPTGFSNVPIQYFDDFSWRSFVAMVWPALQGQRGTPDTNQQVGAVGGPLVFETYKADWEVFQPAPTPSPMPQPPPPPQPNTNWNTFAGQVPCPNVSSVGFNDLVLASFSKFGNLQQAGFGKLVGPLVAQNQTYVRYLAAFNQTEFTQIMNGKLYILSNLQALPFSTTNNQKLTFPNGAIDVKSAWIVMTNIQHPERYYTRQAYVLNPATNLCSNVTVGLVGLHIVQKTPSRPQWIWSTFEQVDNIGQTGAQAPFAFSNASSPTATPTPAMPAVNPIPTPMPTAAPTPFNVQRLLPIDAVPFPGLSASSTTMATNQKYQQALAKQGSGVWQFYQLVMTQWPNPGNTPKNSGNPSVTFPGNGATTAFANITMETFDQNSPTTSCMACHTGTKSASDFLWALSVNAWQPGQTPPVFALSTRTSAAAAVRRVRQPPLTPELKRLKQILQSAATARPAAKAPKRPRGRRRR